MSGQRRVRAPGPAPTSYGKRHALAAALAAAMVALGYVGHYGWTPHRGRGAVLRVVMPEGHDASAIAHALADAGLVDHPRLFAWMLRLTLTPSHVAPGTMSFRDDMTPRRLIGLLRAGRWLVRVVVPEGSTRFEIAQRLVDAGLFTTTDEFVSVTSARAVTLHDGAQTLSHAAISDEGLLFPDTYDLPNDTTPLDVRNRMVANFWSHVARVRARHPEAFERWRPLGVGVYEWIVLASMVERETGAAEDRPRVAAVFYNRLARETFVPHVLQSDPTIVYGCRVVHPPSCVEAPETGRVPITRAMLEDSDNTYNTYRHAGVPPGPIANPGERSLEATLAPPDTDDLYFVAMGDGRSAFAATEPEHEANVARFLRGHRGDAGTP